MLKGQDPSRRAAQVCRPYERAGQFPVVTLIRPLRGHLSLPPLAFGHFPLTGGIGPLEGGRLSGGRKGRPYGVFCAGSVGPVKSGAEVELRNLEFLLTQGPVARNKLLKATPFLRAGNFMPSQRGNPRNGGSRGRAAWRQGGFCRTCRLRPPPSGSLVTFWPSRKSLAPQGETL